MINYKKIDKECVSLCKAINRIEGLQTASSCCGHNKDNFSIYFTVQEVENFPILLYFIDACHVGFNWDCYAYTDCGMFQVKYMIQSRTFGEESYKESEIIATKINEYLERQSA